MKKKKFKRHRDRVRHLVTVWSTAFGLGYWRVVVEYYDSRKQFKKGDKAIAVMRAYAKWQYCTLTIDVCVPEVARVDDDHLEYIVVHELCHALVNEMREDDPDIKHEERVVTMLAKAMLWVRDLQPNHETIPG